MSKFRWFREWRAWVEFQKLERARYIVFVRLTNA